MVEFFSQDNANEITRRKLMAEQLRAQSQMRPTEVVSGYAVPQSPLAGLASMLSQGVAGYQEGKAAELEKKDAEMRQKFLMEAIKGSGGDSGLLAEALMSNPAYVDQGLKVYSDSMKSKADAAQWERDAALKRELQGMRSGGSYVDESGNIVEAPPKLRPMPSTLARGILENRQNLNKAQKAYELMSGNDTTMGGQIIKGDSEATGWKGFLPDKILQRVDPEGVPTRAAIADIGSMVIHDRSGAAVTAAEFPRLAPFIPSEKDNPEVAKEKLRNFVATYQQLVDDGEVFYKESGYQVPERKALEVTKPEVDRSDPRVQKAIEAGYSEEEIKAYMRGR